MQGGNLMSLVDTMITSRQNEVVKRARALARGKDISGAAVMCVEGIRLLEEALIEGVRFDTVFVSPKIEATERGARLRQDLLLSGNPVLEATDDVLESISDAAGDQGAVGLAYKRRWKPDELFPGDRTPLVVLTWGVQDPGNLGTIMRTADAVGVTGLIATARSACPYNTKCIRATMGSIFRLPLLEIEEDLAAIRLIKEHETRLIGTALVDNYRHVDVKYNRPVAIVFGGEGGGVPEHVLNKCIQTVRIPIRRGVESLNVATAAAVILYEAARQRDFKGMV